MSGYQQANRVPAEPFIPYITSYLAAQEDREIAAGQQALEGKSGILGPLAVLAEQLGVSPDTIRAVLKRKRSTIDFDVVDQMMAVMDLTQEWVAGDLSHIYHAAPIPEEPTRYEIRTEPEKIRCELPGCSNEFSAKRTRGGQPKRFCSPGCRVKAARKRRTVGKREAEGRPVRYSNPNDQCLHGHDWAEDNTYWVEVNGKLRRRCRTCSRARMKKYDERKARLRREAKEGKLAA